MGFAAIPLQIAGTAVSTMGALSAGNAKGQAYDYQAVVADNAAKVARQNQRAAEAAGEARVGAQGMKTRAGVGAIRTQIAANNVDVDSGSAADVQSAAAALGALDALSIRDETAREVYGYRVQENEAKSRAQMSRMEASSARRAGKINALSNFLAGASSVSGRWSSMGGAAGGGGGPNAVDLMPSNI